MKETGSQLYLFEGQLDKIINLDESEISTDGTSKIAVGCPATTYTSTDSSLPKEVEATNKSGYIATFIGGSTVSGSPLPPHFQLKSTAWEDNKTIDTKFLTYVPKIVGKYGFGNVVENECKVNCNAKSGMDAVDFSKYLQTYVMPLYPDAQDNPGKRVLIIVDSGPGRIDMDMLATLRAHGFYLMAGVPNTTHVTQATDRNYGPFKTIYRTNLKELTRQHQASRTTIKVNDVPLLVFGGGGSGLRNTFEETTGVSNNISV